MNIDQITQGILAKFEKSRIVFWQDEDKEFLNQLDELILHTDDATPIEIIKLDEVSPFQAKERVELLEPEQPFLIYSSVTPSQPERDWLYDMRLYSESFYADSSAITLNDLGMRMEFRPVITKYKAFFTNKKRVQRLKKLLPHNATKEELELALIAATLKVETPSFVFILLHQIVQFAELVNISGDFSDEVHSDTLFIELSKFNLSETFWHFVKEELGYGLEKDPESEIQPTPLFQDLVVKLLFTECYQALQNSGVNEEATVTERFNDQLLPIPFDQEGKRIPLTQRNVGMNSAERAMVVTVVKNLRERRSMSHAYNILASAVEREFELKNILSLVKEPELLHSVETFEYADQQLIVLIAQSIHEISQIELENLITHRLSTHWVINSNAEGKPDYASILKAIKAAKQFYALKAKYIDGFHYDSARAMYKAYEQELFLFDTAYREFCDNAIRVAHNGSDILKKTGLVSDIENLYVNWYLHDMAIAWGNHVDAENLLDSWKIFGVGNQYDFYNKQVNQIFNTSQVKRVFVIISDALRYEVAHEISNQINVEKRYKSEIKSQLGVVPSYTQLGMASLLPHDQLTAHLGSKVTYKADGISVHGHDNRKKILANKHGLAFKASEVLNWTNDEGRQKIKDSRVVYIYHDKIDATGDKAVSEDHTFAACSTAITEIKQLVERVINRLNATRVFVTADHGFLFKSSDVVDADKTALTVKPQGTIEASKRFLIGSNLPEDDYYWRGNISATANLSVKSEHNINGGDDAEFIVPRGSNRFNFIGGAKFIHGGIMPQEICVPVIKVQQLKTEKQITKNIKERVAVVPLANPIKLVSLADKIELFQASPVGGDYVARELELWIEDPNGKQVSHPQKVMFDSISELQEDRKRLITIMLNGAGFDRTISYKLVMKDITQAKQTKLLQSYSVIIDIAIEDDFF